MTAGPEPAASEPSEALPFGVVVAGNARRIVLRLTGELDLSAEPALDRIVAGLIDVGVGDVVVDLSGVRFADAGGLRALMRSRSRLLARGSDLVLRSPQPGVDRLLQLLAGALPMEASVARRRPAATRPDPMRPAHRSRQTR